MITREQAIDAAIDYLTGGLRRRLEAFEGWPGGVDQHRPVIRRPVAAPDHEPHPAVEASTRPVWRVLVRGDVGHVGSDHYVIVDADTGTVFRELDWGE